MKNSNFDFKKFEKEIVFESSVLAWIRIRIEQNAGSGSVLNQSGSTTLILSAAERTVVSTLYGPVC
jgi:hypothetical protein